MDKKIVEIIDNLDIAIRHLELVQRQMYALEPNSVEHMRLRADLTASELSVTSVRSKFRALAESEL